jgi:hypothetical protein
MTALTRRQTLVGAAATAVAAALPAAAEAEPGLAEIVVNDSVEDNVGAWALYDGGPCPPFPIATVNAAPLLREFKERLRANYGIG